MANKNLNAAKTAKKDEFYTQMSDIEMELQHYWQHFYGKTVIEMELQHYWQHFYGKTVLCSCDGPYESDWRVQH